MPRLVVNNEGGDRKKNRQAKKAAAAQATAERREVAKEEGTTEVLEAGKAKKPKGTAGKRTIKKVKVKRGVKY